jgi:hypothetical protein
MGSQDPVHKHAMRQLHLIDLIVILSKPANPPLILGRQSLTHFGQNNHRENSEETTGNQGLAP